MHGVVHGVEDGVVVSVEDKKYLYHLRPSIVKVNLAGRYLISIINIPENL